MTAIVWHNQYDGTDVQDLTRLYASFAFKDNGKKISLPVKYNTHPLVKAKALLELAKDYSAMKIGSISGMVCVNDDTTRPADPGSEPSGETFKFKARRQGEPLEDDLSFHIPAFVTPAGLTEAQQLAAVQSLGESMAAELSEANVIAVRFVGTTGSRRR